MKPDEWNDVWFCLRSRSICVDSIVHRKGVTIDPPAWLLVDGY